MLDSPFRDPDNGGVASTIAVTRVMPGDNEAMKCPIAQSTTAVLFTAVGILIVAASAASAQVVPIPNSQFTKGEDAPTGWTLSGGKGQWIDQQILEVAGSGEDSNFWRCDYRFTPGRPYRFAATGRGTPSQGSAIVGPSFANRDYRSIRRIDNAYRRRIA